MKKNLCLLVFVLILFSIVVVQNRKIDNTNYNYVYMEKIEIPYIYDDLKEDTSFEVLDTFTGVMTSYGPDCVGCSGITASSYDVRNTIYYHDLTYGDVHIVAADRSIPFGSIVRFSNVSSFGDFIGIVLDRGSAIGFNKSSQFDLLLESEEVSSSFGRVSGVLFEVLRYGF